MDSMHSATPTQPVGGIPTPPFRPTLHSPAAASPLATATEAWQEVLVSSCHFGRSVFLSTLKSLCLHPERNSSLILRADTLPPRPIASEETPSGMEAIEEVRVRLMPRQPNRDGRLEQRCHFFRADPDPVTGRKEEAIVTYRPEVKERAELPYYYPPVRGLAYRWEAVEPELQADGLPRGLEGTATKKDGPESEERDSGPPVVGRISISYVAWPDEPPPPSDGAHDQVVSSLPPRLAGQRSNLPKRRSPLAAPPVDANGDVPTAGQAIPPPAKLLSPMKPSLDMRKSTERISRVCRVLLETVYRHGFGQMTGYRKRVNHDVIVGRDAFQDLYLYLKERHRHLDSRAPKENSTSTKVEDVKRHVFKEYGLPDDPLLPISSSHTSFAATHSGVDLSEWGEQDVAIAAFLMLLWRDMYPARDAPQRADGDAAEEWDAWGRPGGGFADLGCGNGLLVHVLTSEGYEGKGYELRKRRTWPAYPPETQANLVELPIDFPSWFPSTMDEWTRGTWPGREECVIAEDSFIIGNHADEITPWIPLLSLIPSRPVPFLSLPCCAHTLDAPFTLGAYTPPPHPQTPVGGFEDGLEQGQSKYKSYIMHLGHVGLCCGWEWEKEGMRVPSTRSWGIVGRKRWATTGEQLKQCREYALGEVEGVRARGAFKVRVKEGKDH